MSELYENLMEALLEVREIRAGRAKSAGTIEIPTNPKDVRKKLKLSQPEFAEFVGVKVATLRNWEQGRRKIPATARRLLHIAEKHPEIIIEMASEC